MPHRMPHGAKEPENMLGACNANLQALMSRPRRRALQETELETLNKFYSTSRNVQTYEIPVQTRDTVGQGSRLLPRDLKASTALVLSIASLVRGRTRTIHPSQL